MKSAYFTNNPELKRFTVEADEISVDGKLIRAVRHGCCGAQDYYQLFNSQTLNKVMDYEAKLYSINIPNSKIEGHLGFFSFGYEPIDGKMIIGTLTFTDGEQIINKVNFVTQDKQKFDHVPRFIPAMEFIALNQRDHVSKNKDEIELWTKNYSNSPKDLTGFQFLIHLVDDSNDKTYTQKLNFINGLVNGNSVIEFDIEID